MYTPDAVTEVTRKSLWREMSVGQRRITRSPTESGGRLVVLEELSSIDGAFGEAAVVGGGCSGVVIARGFVEMFGW